MFYKLRDWIDLDKINWYYLTRNKNKDIIKLLKQKPDKIDWLWLSSNSNMIEYLEKNQDKINWINLSCNYNAIKLLKKNPKKINWYNLSSNPNAIELLKKNQNKIKWGFISFNPAIFTNDYEKIKENKKELNEEIIIKALHPKRMLKLMEVYGEDEIYMNYFEDD